MAYARKHLNATLLPDGTVLCLYEKASDIVAADEITRKAGLGAMSAAEECAVVKQFLGEAREHLSRLGAGFADVRDRIAVRS